MHDSSARHPPPLCHPGTREVYISRILSWAGAGNNANADGSNGNNSKAEGMKPTGPNSQFAKRVLWLQGLAGVGKSAVAQSCAEALRAAVDAVGLGILGASFFFSRPNSRDDPDMFFTTIAYQLANRITEFGDILDGKIKRDPTLVDKALPQQFSELIVQALEDSRGRGREIGELVIIVDGLDEFADNAAQQIIIEVTTTPVRGQSTPSRWMISSRPEPHIVSVFNSPDVQPLCLSFDLPVSRDIDNEIFRYLSDELSKIRREHGLPPSWPSIKDIGILVELSAGLFIYAATVIRFVCQENSPGPEDQLRLVLDLSNLRSGTDEHPLSELDEFYSLIMHRIPPKVLPTTLKILAVASLPSNAETSDVYASILGLSESQFRNACRPLYSVMVIGEDDTITFYHASFLDFLKDERRSKEYWVMRGGDGCAGMMRREMLVRLNDAHHENHQSTVDQEAPINFPLSWPGTTARSVYSSLVERFFSLCQLVPLDESMLNALIDFDYSMIPIMWHRAYTSEARFLRNQLSWGLFLRNIPPEYYSKIVRPYHLGLAFFAHGLFPVPMDADWESPYILGHGKGKVLWWKCGRGSVIGPYWRFRVTMIPKLIKIMVKRGEHRDGGSELSTSDFEENAGTP